MVARNDDPSPGVRRRRPAGRRGYVIALKPLVLSGREVWPLVEGGKGISISNGLSSGAWAATGGIGTFSGVNGDYFDEQGRLVPMVYRGRTRLERHEELINYSINAAISQARIAHEVRGGDGRLHMNVLWEMAACERVLNGVLEGARGLIHGITCGAGMPYRLAEIAAKYNVYYYPIVSSARAFRALWKRAYHRVSEWLGGVVYEDPWRAGGHNGLSNSEDPTAPEPPYPRVRQLRDTMRDVGLDDTAIIMAGGVWHLRDWQDWLDNRELGPVGFQFGTRPLLTRESPISDAWKRRLLELEEGDVLLHRFSPTGFYSSAVRNDYLRELEGRSARQIPFATVPDVERGLTEPLAFGTRGRWLYVRPQDMERVRGWIAEGYSQAMKTPEDTVIYVSPEKAIEIRRDQTNCMGCLSACKFSNWACNESHTTGKPPDPRSFCIQKTLHEIAHGAEVRTQLMFSGHNVYKFRQDPFYSNGFIPTVRQLVDRIATGD
jgi:NAD(P)H-dependent flavin oxidoreductase YrpB (nitropropane dioxygenase family)